MNIATPDIMKKDIKSIVSTTYDQVNKICYPLFKSTPISYFSYAKMYDSGEMLFFNTQPDLAGELFNNGSYASLDELNLFNSLGLKSTLMSPNLPLPLGVEASKIKYKQMITSAAELSFVYGYFVVDRGEDFYRICGFGTHVDKNSMVNFYLNAHALFKTFISYFEHHASELIENSPQSDRVYLDKYLQKIVINDFENSSLIIPQLDFKVKTITSGDVILTEREQACLDLIARGYTMKNAALKLEISHRTVEQHLRNLKEKLNVHTKNQLVDYWHSSRNKEESYSE